MVRKSNKSSKSRRSPRARERAHRQRLSILRAAGVAFRRFGFAQTGMREIAREADLSTANLYYYFKGKDELLAFCQDQALDRMLTSLERARRNGASADQRLSAIIRAQILCMLDDLGGAAAHLEFDALPRRDRLRILRKRDRYERALRKIILSGVRDGTLTTKDPTLATRAILGAINWSARWYQPDGPNTPAEIAELFAESLVKGLRPQPPQGGNR